MKTIDNIQDLRFASETVVTSGTFDGVHLGHQKILRDISQRAKNQGRASVVVTFWPHPRFVLQKNHESLKLLSTFEEREALIAQQNIDYLVKIPFTREFAQMTSEAFVQQIIVDRLHTKQLVIGYDHKFGKNREGGFEYLSKNAGKYGFEVVEIPREDLDDVGVSSTKIRTALTTGDIPLANQYLGRKYTVSGLVKEGDRIGRSIGYPTANIAIPESYKLVPKDGAYAVLVAFDGDVHRGMLNIGLRPTVSGEERRIEVHIFDFHKDVYNQRLSIRFHSMLREEQKFESIDKLREQLVVDKSHAIKILEND